MVAPHDLRGGLSSGSTRLSEWSQPTQTKLRRVLVGTDAVAISGTWALALGPYGGPRGSGAALYASVGVITLAALALAASQQLYLARVCRFRVVELSRIVRVAALTALGVHLLGGGWLPQPSVALSAGTAVAMAIAVSLTRALYNGWLRRLRRDGRHSRLVVVVAPGGEATAIKDLLQGHPELGFRFAATVGSGGPVLQVLREQRSDTVIIAAAAFSASELNHLTRELLDHGVHIHLSTGLSGIDQRRLRPQPIAREPMFYLEPIRILPWQATVKRLVDIIGASVGLVVFMPVFVAAAVAVKLNDGGPVLFRHKRVGRNGVEFTLFKLRTMLPNADRQLHLVEDVNQRTGPLFKSHHDRRVTRVGRLLRATSLDELPQLINVLLGSMSLVGPRPALAHEVAQFDDQLRSRDRVRPGITGLWQVEGRDDPSFETYRRLDLYYIENWSLELDLVVLLATARAVVVQAMQDLRQEWKVKVIETHEALELASPVPEGVN